MALSQSSRQLVILGVAVLLAGALGTYAYYGVFVINKAQQDAKSKDERLVPFEKADVQKFVVAAKGSTTTVERVDETTWKITSPVTAGGDAGVIVSLLDKLTTAGIKQVATETPKSLSEFGLDHPQVSITATTKAGKDASFLIGNENKFDGTLFVKTGDKPRVAVAESQLKFALEKSTYDLREKRLLPVEDKDVIAVAVKAGGNEYALARQDAGWKLTAPLEGPADDTVARRIASSIRSVRSTAIVAETVDDPKKYGFDAPKAQVTVTVLGGAKTPIVIGQVKEGETEKTYARAGEGFVAEIPDTVIKDVTKTVSELRDKRLLPTFDRDKVVQVKFSGKEGAQESFVVERRKEKDGDATKETWAVLAPHAAPAKGFKMDSVLQALSAIKGESIVEENADALALARFGLDQPTRVIAAFGDAGAEVARVQVGAEVQGEEGVFYARASSAPRVFKVKKTALDTLPALLAEVEDTPPEAAAKK
jgi:hypothetical protein